LAGYPIFLTHVMLWSEALFLILGFAGMAALASWLTRPAAWKGVLAGVLTGLALLTRFAGLPFALAGAAAILLLAKRSRARRWTDALLYLALSLAPLLMWMGFASVAAGEATNRSLSLHPPGLTQAMQALTTLGAWFQLPASTPWPVVGLALAGWGLFILVGVIGFRRDEGDATLPPLVVLLLLFMPIYGAFLLLSLTFFDANTPLDHRILVPFFVAGVMLTLFALTTWWDRAPVNRRWVRVALVAMLGLFLLFSWRSTLAQVRIMAATGAGWSSARWRTSPTLSAVQALPPSLIIYSNAPEAVYLWTGRPARSLPRLVQPMTRQVNPAYEEELDAMAEDLTRGEGVLVYFTAVPRLWDLQDLRQKMRLWPVLQHSDGIIYIHPDSTLAESLAP
jgi:4-amino-4-deoxy-L-arabinose transferase-like glycosyltransferase